MTRSFSFPSVAQPSERYPALGTGALHSSTVPGGQGLHLLDDDDFTAPVTNCEATRWANPSRKGFRRPYRRLGWG